MRGKLGVSTVTHKMKKPNRSQCIRYWGVKPKKKRGKNK